MTQLKSLVIDKLEVSDLSMIANLENLSHLHIVKLKPTKNMDVLCNISSLKKLWIDESKNITDYSFLKGAKGVIALGVEGDIWTKQKIDSFSPFQHLDNLEALFLSSVQVKDKNLDYFATNPKLKHLWISRCVPKSSFDSLRQLMPYLDCMWCDDYEAQ